MQTFLTKTSVKKVVLLDHLLEKNDWCTIKELKSLLKVTNKSVLHYIEELSGLFEIYDGRIYLLNDENKRFYVKKEEDFPIYAIYLHFYKASYNYQLIDFMYRQPEKSLKDLRKSNLRAYRLFFDMQSYLVHISSVITLTFSPISSIYRQRKKEFVAFTITFTGIQRGKILEVGPLLQS